MQRVESRKNISSGRVFHKYSEINNNCHIITRSNHSGETSLIPWRWMCQVLKSRSEEDYWLILSSFINYNFIIRSKKIIPFHDAWKRQIVSHSEYFFQPSWFCLVVITSLKVNNYSEKHWSMNLQLYRHSYLWLQVSCLFYPCELKWRRSNTVWKTADTIFLVALMCIFITVALITFHILI